MAIRPVFVSDDVAYVKTVNTRFQYHCGLSDVQRQRSAESLHAAFKKDHPDEKVLEISSFSKDTLGKKLSAFNLPISLNDGRKVPLEAAYQASKIFENGGPYKDLLDVTSIKAKKDPRLFESGKIIGFDFEGRSIPISPATLCYTWLYITALNENTELANQVCLYNAFTDIVFNPDKALNCQAFACAVYVSLRKKNEVERALTDLDFLSDILKMVSNRSESYGSPDVSPKRMPSSRQKLDLSPLLKSDRSYVFEINDTIIHPKYGKGTVMKTEVSDSGSNIIEVEFQSLNTIKRLSADWVREHCTYKI